MKVNVVCLDNTHAWESILDIKVLGKTKLHRNPLPGQVVGTLECSSGKHLSVYCSQSTSLPHRKQMVLAVLQVQEAEFSVRRGHEKLDHMERLLMTETELFRHTLPFPLSKQMVTCPVVLLLFNAQTGAPLATTSSIISSFFACWPSLHVLVRTRLQKRMQMRMTKSEKASKPVVSNTGVCESVLMEDLCLPKDQEQESFMKQEGEEGTRDRDEYDDEEEGEEQKEEEDKDEEEGEEEEEDDEDTSARKDKDDVLSERDDVEDSDSEKSVVSHRESDEENVDEHTRRYGEDESEDNDEEKAEALLNDDEEEEEDNVDDEDSDNVDNDDEDGYKKPKRKRASTKTYTPKRERKVCRSKKIKKL